MTGEKDLGPTPKYFVCKKHGNRGGDDAIQGKCSNCDLRCETCGEVKSFPFMAPPNEEIADLDPHKDCERQTDSFWMTSDETDFSAVIKDEKINQK